MLRNHITRNVDDFNENDDIMDTERDTTLASPFSSYNQAQDGTIDLSRSDIGTSRGGGMKLPTLMHTGNGNNTGFKMAERHQFQHFESS